MIFTALTCTCADIFDKTGEVFAGGEALNFACAVKAADPGISAYIIGAVGTDEAGRTILDTAKHYGINTEYLHPVSGKTASNRTYLTENGDRYYKEDSWDGGVYQTYRLDKSDEELLLRSDLVHTSIYCPSLKEIFSLKERGNFRLSVDFNDCRSFSEWEELLGATDLFFISGDETVCGWAKGKSLEYGGIFVVTLGADGSRAYHKGKEYSAEAVKVEKVVDTTGCGDSFQAGFAVEYMKTENTAAALKQGAEAASKVIGIYGGVI